jgi:simple sugar transport system substrate-binding protein
MTYQKPDQSNLTRRGLLAAATLLGASAAGLASGAGQAFADNATQATGGLPKKPYKFHFVCHVTLDQFFTPTVYGIQDACAAFGCSYQ